MRTDGHLSPETIERYRSKALDHEGLVTATAHLAECPECRAHTLHGSDLHRLGAAIEPEHLTFEQLQKLSEDGIAGNEDHITSCEMCAAELENLRSFRASLKTARPERGKRSLWLWIPASTFAVALLTFVGIQHSKPGSTKPVIPPSAPPALASFRDVNGLVALGVDGDLHGLDGVPPEDLQTVAAALKTGEIPRADLRDLTRSRETQLAGGDEPARKAAVSLGGPAGTVVLEDKPVFRWIAMESATEFRIRVFDTDFNPVLLSPALRQTHEWVADKPLIRNKTYIWTVTAKVKGETMTVPRAPEPEARFRVAPEPQAAALRALASRSQLAFALAAWKRGARDDARTAIAALRQGNPGSAELSRIADAMALPR